MARPVRMGDCPVPNAARHEGSLRRAALAGLALPIGLVLWTEWDRFVSSLGTTVRAAGLFVLLAMGAGYATERVPGADRRERFAISVEFATTYFFTESVPMLLAAALFRRRKSRGSDPA